MKTFIIFITLVGMTLANAQMLVSSPVHVATPSGIFYPKKPKTAMTQLEYSYSNLVYLSTVSNECFATGKVKMHPGFLDILVDIGKGSYHEQMEYISKEIQKPSKKSYKSTVDSTFMMIRTGLLFLHAHGCPEEVVFKRLEYFK